MRWYFASEVEDAEDIFELMTSWWGEIFSPPLSLDIDLFIHMHRGGNLLTVCGRDESNKLVACYVGTIAPDLFRKGKKRLDQLACCLHPTYRSVKHYKELISIIEKICSKLRIDNFSIDLVNKRMERVMEKEGFEFDVISMNKEVGNVISSK